MLEAEPLLTLAVLEAEPLLALEMYGGGSLASSWWTASERTAKKEIRKATPIAAPFP